MGPAVQVSGRQWQYWCREQQSEGLAAGTGCGRVLAVPDQPLCCCSTSGCRLEAEPHLCTLWCCCHCVIQRDCNDRRSSQEGWRLGQETHPWSFSCGLELGLSRGSA